MIYETYGDSDIVSFENNLSVENLLKAYANGIFPWPDSSDDLIPWFCPLKRGVLFFNELHISRTLKKILNKNEFSISVNKNFLEVIKKCAKIPRKDQSGTWINEKMINAYYDLHKEGYAKSIESYYNKELVGGIYGVLVNGVFSAESMFHKKSYASSICFLHLIKILKKLNIEWMDLQVLTPHMKKMGGKEIDRNIFINMILKERKRKLSNDEIFKWFSG